MNPYFAPSRRNARWSRVLGYAGLVVLVACASPPPSTNIAAARAAIVGAEKADAGRYAAPELAEARAKLAGAEAAVTSEHMPEALRLADESAVEADLANAKAGEAKALAVNADMKQGNAVLGDELQRGSGGQP